MKKLSRLSACLAATGLITAAAVAGSTAAANAATVTSCSAKGANANCGAAATIKHPDAIGISVTSAPHQTVFVAWTLMCSRGSTTRKASGNFHATTPLSRTLSRTLAHPDSCLAAIGVAIPGGSVRASIWSSHQVMGYANLCADDKGNSIAPRNKIVTGTCNGGASQQWAFSRGALIHRGMCANAKGAAGSPVVLNKCNGTANDLWTRNSKGEYVLKAHGGTLCLTDPGFSKRNGTQLVVAACRNGANQHWTLP
jgi:hypothetical protein